MNPLAYARKFTDTAVTGLFDQLRRNREIALNAAEHPKCLMTDAEKVGNFLKCKTCGEAAKTTDKRTCQMTDGIGYEVAHDSKDGANRLAWCHSCGDYWTAHACTKCQSALRPRFSSWCDKCSNE